MNRMHKLTALTSLGAVAAALVTPAAQAQSSTDTVTVTVTAPNGAPLRGVTPALGQSLNGRYRMADGRVMVLRQRGAYIVADLEDVPLARLQVAEKGLLLSEDGRMQLQFDADPNSDRSEVLVTLAGPVGQQRPLAALKLQR